MIFAGSHGSGKSWHAIGMALALSEPAQADWLGFRAEKPMRTMYFQAELSKSSLAERLLIVCGKLGIDPSQLSMFTANGTFRVDFAPSLDIAIKSLQEHHIEALIIDPLQRFHQLDENSATDMNRVLANFTRIRDEVGLKALILIHHYGKGGGQRGFKMRGSSAFADWPSTRVMFDVFTEGNGRLEFITRDCELPDPMDVVFEEGIWKPKI